jgi:hypothetical protein
MRTALAPVLAIAVVAFAGCSAASSPPEVEHAARPPDSGHDLVMKATSCWMGGLWGDALGETDDVRRAGIERRCDAVLSAAGLRPADRFFPLRAVEPYVVNELAVRVWALAAADPTEAPHALELTTLLRGIADAARETLDARRAADVVKDNFALQPDPSARAHEKVAAAAKLRRGQALNALFHLDAGPYTEEAHAAALLFALDRMEIARGLPKHLKTYAVQGALEDTFGVSSPAVSDEAAAPIPTGTWLRYLTKAAAAAGHPVPADAHDPQNREPLAWTGVLQGFADRLRANVLRLGAGPLAMIALSVAERLDQEFRNERIVYEARLPEYR